MHEFCLVCLLFSVQLDIAFTQRWWYVPIPSYAQQPPRSNSQPKVAGWAQSPTTEPPLGPNDRINTTDVPEEIEPRPDQTRAQRRRMLKRMNPGATSQQIEAQLIKDDKARARMAATQSEPVVLLPEPVTPPTKPPPIQPSPKPIKQKQTKQTQTKQKTAPKRQTNQNNTIKKQTNQKPANNGDSQLLQVWRPSKPRKLSLNPPSNARPQNRNIGTQQTNKPEVNNGDAEFLQIWRPPVNQPRTGRPQNRNMGAGNVRWRRPRPIAPATEPLPPTTFPPTYPTTQYQYIPTTYPTVYPYNDSPIVTNPPRRRGPPRRQQPFRQQRRRPRPRLGRRRRQRNRARNEGEEFRPRDPLARWIYNNIEGEVLESFLPLFALG